MKSHLTYNYVLLITEIYSKTLDPKASVKSSWWKLLTIWKYEISIIPLIQFYFNIDYFIESLEYPHLFMISCTIA